VNIEDRLRELTVEASTVPRRPLTNRNSRRIRARRISYGVAGPALVVGLILGATLVLPHEGSRNKTPPVPPSSKIHRSSFVIYRNLNPTFSIRYPGRWYRAKQSLTPLLTSPRELFSLGTRPLRYRGTDCAHLPKSAFQDLSSKDAFISVEESGGPGFAKRPADFRTGAHPMRRFDCMPRHAPLRYYWILFRDSGREFYALVVIGTHASVAVKDQTWAALNSFSTTTTPRPSCSHSGDGYRPVLTPTSGMPGSQAMVSGKLPQTGESGQAVPTTKVDVWWNLDPHRWTTALTGHPVAASPGEVFSLTGESVKGACGYRVSYRIPAVPSGKYPLVILYSGGGGTARLEPVTFHVGAQKT
jgi:hypothetical protein